MTTPQTAGTGQLFTSPDVDLQRAFFKQKNKALTDKTTTVRQAVSELIKDGDYLAVGGFGGNRIPTSILHEIVRQKRKNLGLSGHTATHDGQILAAGKCFDRCDIAYVVGLEARGLSKSFRRMFESGEAQMTEWTNAALSWRYKAAAMGIPFIPARSMLGSDTFRYSAAKTVTCPFTGVELAALPALFPDVAVIHVHRADIYGNCQIDGPLIADDDLAKASRRVIITTEQIVSNDDIRRQPEHTVIPFWCVDAVIEVPYGSYPGNMPGCYFSDESHLRDWLAAENDPAVFEAFLKEQIYDCPDFQSYLMRNGGFEKLRQLRRTELLID